METTEYKIIFFGGSSYVIPIVESLNKFFNLSKVIVKNENDPLVNFCKENNISVEIAKSSNEIENIIKEVNPVVGIIADFGLILPESTLNLIPKGILNIHPSLLPQFRGPTPAQTALLEGVSETGVTLFKLDSDIDHGPIISQEEFEIPENFTSTELLTTLFKLGAKLIEDNLEDYINGDILPQPQSEENATYTKTFSKKDGFIDLSETNSLKIKNLKLKIHAYHPWPGVFTKYNLTGKEVIIKFLPNEEIQVEGKKPMKYKDFKNGYKKGEELLKKVGLN